MVTMSDSLCQRTPILARHIMNALWSYSQLDVGDLDHPVPPLTSLDATHLSKLMLPDTRT
jgi:hypothetical protein